MKKRNVLLLLVLAMMGIAILAYPNFRDYLYRRNAAYAIHQSAKKVDSKTASQAKQLAIEYNASLHTDETKPAYREILDFGNGLMGSLEIPKIQVYLPIYHGTDSQVLAMGIGHLEGSALPIGGVGNHTVLTGHTGLPSAELLTDLTEISLGDMFYIHVLQDTLSYQVVDVQIVLPDAANLLQPEPDRDLCTLVTCTPYGVNSHRLLVQGERVEEKLLTEHPKTQSSAVPMPWSLIAAAVAMLFLTGISIYVLFRKR